MTGADSPVIADSSTEATPSMTSPSPGMTSPAVTMTTSPLRSSSDGTICGVAPWWGSCSFLAHTVLRRPRRAAAWALPRPSATASAKLAKSTVNHSHSVIARMKPAGASPSPPSAWTNRPVVNTLPSQTTNITGFLIWWRGDRRLKDSTAASRSSAGSVMD
jgi:uncharacterized protein (DUF427 family)